MKNKFQLQTLLELRQRERDAIEQQFVQAQRALSDARTSLERAEQAAESLANRIRGLRRAPPPLDMSRGRQHVEYVRALEIELDDKRRVVHQAHGEVADAANIAQQRRAALAKAEASVEAIEKQRAAWKREQERRQTQRAEDQREDLALRQWMENSE